MELVGNSIFRFTSKNGNVPLCSPKARSTVGYSCFLQETITYVMLKYASTGLPFDYSVVTA